MAPGGSKTPDLDKALQDVDAATTRLGDNMGRLSVAVDGASIRIDKLVNDLSAAPTPAEIADLKAKVDVETTRLDAVSLALDSTVTVLNGLAAAPVDPVPEPVPELPPDIEIPPDEA